MAGAQSRCYGMHLVRRPVMDWRTMRVSHDCVHMAFIRSTPKSDQISGYGSNCELHDWIHPVLARIATIHLVPSAQDQTSVHGEGDCLTYWRHRTADLECRSSWRGWSNRPSGSYRSRLRSGVGSKFETPLTVANGC
jgi:hypothetical protein